MTILTLARAPACPLAVRRRERPVGAETRPADPLPRRHLFAHRRHHRVHRRIGGTHGPHPAQPERRGVFVGLRRGHAPTRPSHYRVATWSAVPHLRTRAHEAEVGWILRNSFPTVDTGRTESPAAGRRLSARSSANIAEHEAIAATQAAIWYFTNDLQLDDRPRNVPCRRCGDRGSVTSSSTAQPQFGGFTRRSPLRRSDVLVLQKSADGVQWRDVTGPDSTSRRGAAHRKVLGLGSTMAQSDTAAADRDTGITG